MTTLPRAGATKPWWRVEAASCPICRAADAVGLFAGPFRAARGEADGVPR